MQGLGGRLAYRHRLLQHDRPGVDSLVDEVHGRAGDLTPCASASSAACAPGRTGARRIRSGSPGKRSKQLAEQAHVAGQDDELDALAGHSASSPRLGAPWLSNSGGKRRARSGLRGGRALCLCVVSERPAPPAAGVNSACSSVPSPLTRTPITDLADHGLRRPDRRARPREADAEVEDISRLRSSVPPSQSKTGGRCRLPNRSRPPRPSGSTRERLPRMPRRSSCATHARLLAHRGACRLRDASASARAGQASGPRPRAPAHERETVGVWTRPTGSRGRRRRLRRRALSISSDRSTIPAGSRKSSSPSRSVRQLGRLAADERLARRQSLGGTLDRARQLAPEVERAEAT